MSNATVSWLMEHITANPIFNHKGKVKMKHEAIINLLQLEINQ